MTTLTRLSQIAEIAKGPIDPSQFVDETFCLYSLPAYDAGQPELIRGSGIKSSKTIINGGHVLISKLNPRIPRVWLVRETGTHRQICSTEFIPFRVRATAKVDPEYLSFMMLAPQFIGQLAQQVRSSTRSHQRVRPADIEVREVPLPTSLQEQRRIVARIRECMERLEEIEGLVKCVRLESDHLPQAFRFDLWQECLDRYPMVDLGSVVISAKNGLYKPRQYHGSGTLLLRMFNINGASFDITRLERLNVTEKEASEYSITNGDIIVSRVNSRELVGKSTVIAGLAEAAVFEAMIIRLRIDMLKARQDVLAWLINSPQFLHNLRMRAKHAIGQSSINQQDLLSSRVPLPPLTEQERIWGKFAGLGSLAFDLRNECTSRSQAANGLRQAILRKAFAGEL